jgi:hypothetical protein
LSLDAEHEHIVINLSVSAAAQLSIHARVSSRDE